MRISSHNSGSSTIVLRCHAGLCKGQGFVKKYHALVRCCCACKSTHERGHACFEVPRMPPPLLTSACWLRMFFRFRPRIASKFRGVTAVTLLIL